MQMEYNYIKRYFENGGVAINIDKLMICFGYQCSLFQALHLIKAVSVLLDFTHDEQQLLKDTLEYKMSWFGVKAPSYRAVGQMAKTIPPSY